MKNTVILLFVFIVFTIRVSAQGVVVNEKLKKIVDEKLKISDVISEKPALHTDNYNRQSIPSKDEKEVAGSDTAESEVHAAINPADSNNIVLCPIKNNPWGTPRLSLPVYYTVNFGKTWKQSSFIAEPNDVRAKVIGGGDPVFVYDKNGRLFLSWIDLYRVDASDSAYWGMIWAYSDDGGKNWIRPQNDVIGLTKGRYGSPSVYLFDEVYDKQWMAADLSNSPYKNTVYISYFKLQLATGRERIVVKKKRPGSNAFDSEDIEISDGTFSDVQFTNISVDGYGYVHIIFWGSKSGLGYGVWHSVSVNGGISYSDPKMISEAQKLTSITGITSNRLYPCPQIACDQNKPYIYATWTSTGIGSSGSSASDIYFSRSTDTGNTWSAAQIINDDVKSGTAKEQFYSSISVNNNGVVTLTWYDGRYSSSYIYNEDVRYFMAHSENYGQTFGKNYCIPTFPTDFRTIGNLNNYFGIGEYTQVLSTNSYAIPVWADGRWGDGNLDIYVGFVKIDSTYLSLEEIRMLNDNLKLEKMYPLPASDYLNLEIFSIKPTQLKFAIYDLNSRLIESFSFSVKSGGLQTFELNTSRLETGNYMMIICSDFGYISRSFSKIRNFK